MSAVYRRLAESAAGQLDATLFIKEITWNKLWAFIQGMAMAPSSLDVSEVGTTWLKSLADADALKPIPADFIEKSRGQSWLSDAAWKSIRLISPTTVLFWPFMLDVRMIYYWRDHLKAARIDETDAFSSIANTRETIEKLRAGGMPGWGATSAAGINTLYEVSSWVWATGKDYMSPDGKQTMICDADVQNAILAYFELAGSIDRPYENYVDLVNAFKQKKVSVMMDGPWMWSDVIHSRYQQIDLGNIGVSSPPGPPFLGGSSLVVWKCVNESILGEVLKLLAVLTSPGPQKALFENKGLLPVNSEVLNAEPFTSDVNLKTMARAILRGRYLPTLPIWGHLESSLVRIFGLVWQSLKTNGLQMKPDLLLRHFAPLAKRFDKMIEMF